MNIVMLEPEIAPNVGNIARLCAATRTVLHLIEPFGFKLDDRQLKRAGMDYWRNVEWRQWTDWVSFRSSVPPGRNIWLVESGGGRTHADVSFGPEDYIVFGRESAGIPSVITSADPEHWIRIPMFHREARSLNVSNCAAIVLYEAKRQQGFAGEESFSAPFPS
ncbi:MAG: tRNA (cytidine(34)-2'-O)-methyltransferase [Verrucomicrobia bacterium]|nr:tRNA (cytidine(34)-2'-O)-methyltransferase [Verrucomicrobiota bacterium]